MSFGIVSERAAPRSEPVPAGSSHDDPFLSTWFREALERDRAQARLYAAGFVKTLGPGSPSWENMAPLIRSGWAVRHDQLCISRHDWRLSWSAAKDGWHDAGGPFDPPRPPTETPPVELIVPARGAHVYDAFGEPAGRVKAVRETDFLLGRPLARDVYVPFRAIIWPGRQSLRIGVPHARVGAMGWEPSKLFGLFGSTRLAQLDRVTLT
jgi:hypothetical protein